MEISGFSSIQSLLLQWDNTDVQNQGSGNTGKAGGPPPPPSDSFKKSSTSDKSLYSNSYGDHFNMTQNSGVQTSEEGVEPKPKMRPGGGPPPPQQSSSTDEDDDYDYYEEFTTNYWNNVEKNEESKAALEAFLNLLGSTIS